MGNQSYSSHPPWWIIAGSPHLSWIIIIYQPSSCRGQLLQLSPPWDDHMAVNAATSTRCLQDEEGAARRRRRRRQRDHGPDSAHSYYSVVSEGGTRHVRRRRKRGDGTYSSSESYHSDDSEMEGGGLAKKKVHC